jgi:tRNA threonylcarbamoyl adenosine modification protein YjeE
MTGIALELADERATGRLGEDIAAILKPGDLLALRGDLGMGKTTLARAIIRALVDKADLDVPSPTFNLVQPYQGRLPVHHFDLYRLSSPQELEELGFEEAVKEGVALVEWPERAGDLLPSDAVTIELEEDAAGRRAAIAGPDGFTERLRRSLEIRAFLEASGRAGAARRFLVGDASTRAYELVTRAGDETVILMNAPRLRGAPVIRDVKSYPEISIIGV